MPRLRIQGRILTLATMTVIWSRFLRRTSGGHFRQRLAEWQGLPGSLARGHVSIGETQILHAGQPFDTVSPGLMAWPITIPPSILAKTPKLSRTCRAHTGLHWAFEGFGWFDQDRARTRSAPVLTAVSHGNVAGTSDGHASNAAPNPGSRQERDEARHTCALLRFLHGNVGPFLLSKRFPLFPVPSPHQ